MVALTGQRPRPHQRNLADDPRYATMQLRQENIDALSDALEQSFLTRTGQEWFDLLSAAGLIVAPVYDVAQCFADPQVRARGVRVSAVHPGGASVDMVASPMRFSATPIERYRCPPPLGRDAEDVLSRWLGYDQQQIAQLRAEGAL